jgi:hypothetical protein
MASVAALLEGCMLCNDSHLHQEVLQDGRQVWVPNGAPTEVGDCAMNLACHTANEQQKGHQQLH